MNRLAEPAPQVEQRLAAELGLALLMPDTSPRGANVPGESDSWDFGVGAGFYLDATREPWAKHWRMESYLMNELLPLVQRETGLEKVGLFGHSMGGHGALTLALRHPGQYRTVSAFAPIANPVNCPWGEKAFSGYLGLSRHTWGEHDATELMSHHPMPPYPQGILIDQGLAMAECVLADGMDVAVARFHARPAGDRARARAEPREPHESPDAPLRHLPLAAHCESSWTRPRRAARGQPRTVARPSIATPVPARPSVLPPRGPLRP